MKLSIILCAYWPLGYSKLCFWFSSVFIFQVKHPIFCSVVNGLTPWNKCRNFFKNYKMPLGDFPGGPVAKTPSFQCKGPEFNTCSGNWIPHVTIKTRHSQINRLFFKYKGLLRGQFLSPCFNLHSMPITLPVDRLPGHHWQYTWYVSSCTQCVPPRSEHKVECLLKQCPPHRVHVGLCSFLTGSMPLVEGPQPDKEDRPLCRAVTGFDGRAVSRSPFIEGTGTLSSNNTRDGYTHGHHPMVSQYQNEIYFILCSLTWRNPI